jgi:hypothetical protein
MGKLTIELWTVHKLYRRGCQRFLRGEAVDSRRELQTDVAASNPTRDR